VTQHQHQDEHQHQDHAAGPTGPGSVVLDIGPGTGALVLFTPAAMLGAEIEISPVAPGSVRSHSQVRQRTSARSGQPPAPEQPNVSYAAVYPGLVAGRYIIWRDAETPAAEITVSGGQVTTWYWPASADGCSD